MRSGADTLAGEEHEAMNASITPPAGDIEHNRRGLLSPEQATYLARYRQMTLLVYIMPLGLFGLMMGSSLLTRPYEGNRGLAVDLLSAGAGLAILVGTVLGCVYVWRRKGALAHRSVTPIDGRVVWAGPPNPSVMGAPSGWAPAGSDGVPFALKQPQPILPPGPYRFYLHDGHLIAAESPLNATTHYSITQDASLSLGLKDAKRFPRTQFPVGDPGALLAGLAATMGFTWEDLQHHRHGMLSPRQGVGRVVVVEGPLTFGWTMHSRSSVTYWWDVGGRQFPIPLTWMWLAPLGIIYRCYVDERSQRLLSMEPVIVPADGPG